ncbi:VanZ family protein [Bacillus salitolerans]|uniref:VanZ family protein n=1 Tax=Bacillus salitolerans TaxID=1437434 RepID=A0ABW4LS41_9BACI
MKLLRMSLYWLPMLIIAGTIFWFSSQPYQHQDVRPLLGEYVSKEWIVQKFSWVEFTYAGREISVRNLTPMTFVEFFIRKGAHVGVFFILGFFTCRAMYFTFSRKKIVPSLVTTALFIILYATMDEIHQHFTGDRTPLINDVMLDSVGGMLGITAFSLYRLIKRSNSLQIEKSLYRK